MTERRNQTFTIVRARKKKEYKFRTGKTPTCLFCHLFDYNPDNNPSQRMSACGVCLLDNTPAISFASCKRFAFSGVLQDLILEEKEEKKEEKEEVFEMKDLTP
jgi:hypothetical protein